MTDINNDYEMYAQLVRKVKTGDEDAFAEIYEKTQRLVYTTCFGILDNEQDAEDAMQETYISVYNGIKELEGEMAFLPWLKRIAANKALDKCRGRKDTASYDDVIGNEEIIEGDDDLENLPEAFVMEKDKRDTLYKILRKELSDDQFRTILLFYYDEMSVKDIASSMQCPENTIKTKLRLARVKIKNGIEKYEKENKISLMGGVVATATIGRFFSEYYGSAKIPTPKNLPFRIAAPKGSTVGKTAAKTAGKAAAASAKTAAGASVAKTLGIIGASVAGIAAITGVVIGIKAMTSEHEIPLVEESMIEESAVMVTTEDTSVTTTETDLIVDEAAIKEAYLEVLAKYGKNILEFEEMGLLTSDSDDYDINTSISYIDIDDNGVDELIFAYKTNYRIDGKIGTNPENVLWTSYVNFVIYTYSEDEGKAVCLLERILCTNRFGLGYLDEWYEVAKLENGNLLIARMCRDIATYSYATEYITEFELGSDNVSAVNSLSAAYYIDDSDYTFTFKADTAKCSDQEITDDEYFKLYEEYKSSVILPIMVIESSDSIGREESEFLESVKDNYNSYTFNEMVILLGGDPATIFNPKYDWKAYYLDLINAFPIEDYDEGYVSNIADCSMSYDLVYINADEIPELAVRISDNNSEVACTLIYTINDGEIVELYHHWHSPSTSFIYFPRQCRVEFIIPVDNEGYEYCWATLFDFECSAIVCEYNIVRSAVDLSQYTDYWSGESTIQDGFFYYYESDCYGRPEYEKYSVVISESEFDDLNPQKSLLEITEDLGQ